MGSGTELVDRSARGFQLTPAGEVLLGYARSVVTAAQSMLAAAAAILRTSCLSYGNRIGKRFLMVLC